MKLNHPWANIRADMAPASPGGGVMGKKCKNMLRPKTVNMRPRRRRAMRVAIFMSKLSLMKRSDCCVLTDLETCTSILDWVASAYGECFGCGRWFVTCGTGGVDYGWVEWNWRGSSEDVSAGGGAGGVQLSCC